MSSNAAESYSDIDLERSNLPSSSAWPSKTLDIKIGRSVMQLSAPRGAVPDWLESAVSQLNGVARLAENWDSYGAPRVHQRTIQHTLQLLLQIMEPGVAAPRILATSSGGVELGWHEQGKELEITVDAPFRGEIYFCDEEADEEEERPFGVDFSVPRRYLDRMTKDM